MRNFDEEMYLSLNRYEVARHLPRDRFASGSYYIVWLRNGHPMHVYVSQKSQLHVNSEASSSSASEGQNCDYPAKTPSLSSAQL